MRGRALRSYRHRMPTQQTSNPGLSSQRSGSEIQAIGAVAGLIGPILFTSGFVVQGLFRRGEYDPIAETVSALEAGPNGWVQQLNFLVFATLMMIFGAGLGSGLRTGRRSIGSAVSSSGESVCWSPVSFRFARISPAKPTIRQGFTNRTAQFSSWAHGLVWPSCPGACDQSLAGGVWPDTHCSQVGRWRSCFSLWPLSRSRLQLRCIHGQVLSNVSCWRCGFPALLRWRLDSSR